jgi:hypothetical protein
MRRVVPPDPGGIGAVVVVVEGAAVVVVDGARVVVVEDVDVVVDADVVVVLCPGGGRPSGGRGAAHPASTTDDTTPSTQIDEHHARSAIELIVPQPVLASAPGQP